MTLDSQVARLAQTRPFNLLPREAVQLIAFSSEKRRLRPGEALFDAGDDGDAGYFVQSGAIALTEKGAMPESARLVGAGSLIGESALYAPVVRRTNARAVDEALVMRVPRETFRRVLSEFPEAAEKVRVAVAQRTRQLLERLEATRARSFAVAPRARPAP